MYESIELLSFAAMNRLLKSSLLIGAFICLTAEIALALGSDRDGISDVIEASNGADPFFHYAVSAGYIQNCALDDHGGRCWGIRLDGDGYVIDQGEWTLPGGDYPIVDVDSSLWHT